MALGGFVIGMMLGESHYRHQINNDIRGFKDILLGLFFVTIGMNIQVDLLIDYWPRLILFTAVLILVKGVLITLVVRREANLTGPRCSIFAEGNWNSTLAGNKEEQIVTVTWEDKYLTKTSSVGPKIPQTFAWAESPALGQIGQFVYGPQLAC